RLMIEDASAEPPSPSTRRAIARLERHADWSSGFWIGYVFTTSPPQAHILQEHLEAKLRARGSAQRLLRPETPEALERILAEVLAQPNAGCTWVEALRAASATADARPWADAWTRMVLRANERRELIRAS